MGAGREDVNVSCKGGTRVEVKGVAHNKLIPELSHNEACSISNGNKNAVDKLCQIEQIDSSYSNPSLSSARTPKFTNMPDIPTIANFVK